MTDRGRIELKARMATDRPTVELEEGKSIVWRWEQGRLSTSQACKMLNGWSEKALRMYAGFLSA